MKNDTIIIKVEQRLNKLSSQDYDNIERWQIIESFNKAQVEWCRRQLHGNNIFKEGDESSKRRIDDLQTLLVEKTLSSTEEDLYYLTESLPSDYFEFKRVDIKGKSECCPERPFVVYLVEEDNVKVLLRDELKQPNFPWAETFVTLVGNKAKVYTNGTFNITEIILHYYKQPVRIEMLGVINPYEGVVSTQEVESEFKDDIVELLIDETVSILSADIELMTQYQRGTQSGERNN